MPSNVVVLGTGLMGSAVIRTLLSSGLQVGVWNRTASRAEPLHADGATIHTSAQAAFDDSPLVISLLGTTAALREVLSEVSVPSGTTVVNFSTGTPDEVRDLHTWAADHGIGHLDGMISGRPESAGSAQMHVTVAGPSELWAEHHDTLERITPEARHLGDNIVAPKVMGLACTGLFFLTSLGAFVEAAAFVAAHGIDPQDVADQMPRYLGRLQTEIEGFTEMIVSGNFETSHATAQVYAEALESAVESQETVDQPGLIARGAIASLQLARDAGRGGESPSVVFDVLT